MTVTMSSEGDSAKTALPEVNTRFSAIKINSRNYLRS